MRSRSLIKVGLALLFMPLALLVLLFGSLRSASLRETFMREVSAQLRQRAQITLQVGELSRFDPWGIDASNVHLVDAESGIDLKVAALSLRLRPLKLLKGEIFVELLRVDALSGSLVLPTTAAEDPENPTEEESSSSLDWLELRVVRLSVRKSKVSLAGLGPYRALHVPSLEAAGSFGERPWVILSRAEVMLDTQQGRVLELHTDSSQWDLARGGSIRLSGRIGHASLRLHAKLRPYDVGFLPGTLNFEVAGFTPQDWVNAGLEAPLLARELTVVGRLHSDGARLRTELELTSAESQARLYAELHEERSTARLYAFSPDLSTLQESLPHESMEVQLEAVLGPERTRRTLRVGWSTLTLGDSRLPTGHLELELGEAVVALRQLVLDDFGAALQARGEWHLEAAPYGRAELKLQALPLAKLSELVPGASGEVSGGVDFASAANGQVKGQAKLNGMDLRFEEVRVSRVQLDSSLSGTLAVPKLVFALQGRSIGPADFALDRVRVDGSLIGQALEARAYLSRLADDLTFLIRADGLDQPLLQWTVSGQGKVSALPVRLAARGNYRPEPGTHEVKADLDVKRTALRAQATLDGQRNVQASVLISAPTLEEWSFVMAPHSMSGDLDAKLSIAGQLDRLGGALTLDARHVVVDAQTPLFASLAATASMPQRRMDARLAVWTEKRDASVTLSASASHRGRRDRFPPIAAVDHQAELHGELALPLLRAYLGKKFDGLEGAVTLHARTGGALGSPRIHAELDTRMKAPQDERAQDLAHVAFDVDQETARLYVRAAEGQRPFMWLNAQVAEPYVLLSRAKSALPRFQLQARVTPRRLDRMQGAWAFLSGIYELDLPIEVAADVNLNGEGALVNGKASLNFRVMSDALDPACVVGAHSDLHLGLDLTDNELSARIHAVTSGGGSVDARVKTTLRLQQRQPDQPWTSDLELNGQGSGITLSQLPGLCELQGGQGSFVVKAHHGPSRSPEALLELGLEGVQAPGGAPIDVSLTARVDTKGTRTMGEFVMHDRQIGSLAGTLPLTWPSSSVVPVLDPQGSLDALLNVKSMPLGPFLAFGKALGRPRGTLTGKVRVSGSMQNPKPSADIAFQDVGFSIASLAQPLHGIRGRVILNDHHLKVLGLTVRDRDGKVRLDGEGFLRGDGTGEAKLRVQATSFPLRRQGEVIGTVTSLADIRATLHANHALSAEVTVDGGRLWLTGDRGRKTQSLKAHPEVRFVDIPPTAEVDASGASELTFVLERLQIESRKGIWVMHRDFSVLVGLDIGLVHDKSYVMTGAAKLERGDLQLLGKTFRIEKGEIRLTGDFPPDPEIVLRAVYDAETGEDLYVSLSGRASAPVLAFSGAASTAGEAMAILSGAGRAGAGTQAQTEARNFALGLTAGLLSVAIREELGEWVPVIIVENDDSGAIARGRAGFEATKLIPEFLRPIARGAYVEGIVGSTDQSGSSVGVGARLEISLPYDFVTSTGYGPGPTWGADILWVP